MTAIRICNRCGWGYEATIHTCEHPLHAAIDPECAYADPTITTPDLHPRCDICRPIRAILDTMST